MCVYLNLCIWSNEEHRSEYCHKIISGTQKAYLKNQRNTCRGVVTGVAGTALAAPIICPLTDYHWPKVNI